MLYDDLTERERALIELIRSLKVGRVEFTVFVETTKPVRVQIVREQAGFRVSESIKL